MTKKELIKEILEAIEWGDRDIFWYIDNKDEAAEYLEKKLNE